MFGFDLTSLAIAIVNFVLLWAVNFVVLGLGQCQFIDRDYRGQLPLVLTKNKSMTLFLVWRQLLM